MARENPEKSGDEKRLESGRAGGLHLSVQEVVSTAHTSVSKRCEVLLPFHHSTWDPLVTQVTRPAGEEGADAERRMAKTIAWGAAGEVWEVVGEKSKREDMQGNGVSGISCSRMGM